MARESRTLVGVVLAARLYTLRTNGGLMSYRIRVRVTDAERYTVREICGIAGLILLGLAAIIAAAGFGG